jgi:3'-phosphoadenosine 5'-phosphosulfate sulfotransferase (PAPS reductase)/FAD synthetase
MTQVVSLDEAVLDASARHIVPLSGGKDSTALAIFMLQEYPHLPLEFLFTDTGAELPETYEYFKKFETIFGVKVTRMTALELPRFKAREKDGRRVPFDYILDEVYSGFLPNPQARWCTRALKIQPFEHFVGDDQTYSYIGIRGDEYRVGYGGVGKNHSSAFSPERRAKPVTMSGKPNIRPVYPFKDRGFGLEDIKRILDESGLGLPAYYEWRSRSGCFFCFYQQIGEWQGLKERHPHLFEKAKTYERVEGDVAYTWSEGRSLEELEKITERYSAPVGEDLDGCAICHL